MSEWAESLQGLTKSLIKEMLKISDFYLDKQKSFIPKKNYKCTMYNGYFFLQPRDVVLCLNSPTRSKKWHLKTSKHYDFRTRMNNFLLYFSLPKPKSLKIRRTIVRWWLTEKLWFTFWPKEPICSIYFSNYPHIVQLF